MKLRKTPRQLLFSNFPFPSPFPKRKPPCGCYRLGKNHCNALPSLFPSSPQMECLMEFMCHGDHSLPPFLVFSFLSGSLSSQAVARLLLPLPQLFSILLLKVRAPLNFHVWRMKWKHQQKQRNNGMATSVCQLSSVYSGFMELEEKWKRTGHVQIIARNPTSPSSATRKNNPLVTTKERRRMQTEKIFFFQREFVSHEDSGKLLYTFIKSSCVSNKLGIHCAFVTLAPIIQSLGIASQIAMSGTCWLVDMISSSKVT